MNMLDTIRSTKPRLYSINKGRTTPLHLACVFGHTDFLSLLIQHKAQINIADSVNSSITEVLFSPFIHVSNIILLFQSRYTPLHSAAYANHAEVVALLIALQADTTATNVVKRLYFESA